jgi:hypothetical protein
MLRGAVLPAAREVLVLAAVLVLLFTAFGLWYWRHSSAVHRPAAPAAAVKPSPPLAAPSVHLAPVPTKRMQDPDPLTLAEAAILAEPVAPPPEPPEPSMPSMPLPPSRRIQGPAPPVPPARLAAVANDPLAPCRALNIFARAVCMNNQCAQPTHADRPQCVQVRRQRQLDEARRNPTLAN